MRDTADFMNDFMEKYKAGKYPKVHQTNDGPELTDAYVSAQISAFSKMLDSDLADDIMAGPKCID